jgi:amino acid transporter
MVARMLEIIGVLFLLVTVGICVIILVQGMNYNILPFFNISDVKNFLPAMKDLSTPFTGLGILFVIPFTDQNKNAPKVAFFTLLFIGLLYVLIMESTVMALGINNTAQTEFECDYFQFDDEFRIKYPAAFEKMDWKKEFTKASVNVDAKIDTLSYCNVDYTTGEVK